MNPTSILANYMGFQLLLVVFLVALLWALHNRLPRLAFFRWWAWAWTCFAVFLSAGVLAVRLGQDWTPARTAVLGIVIGAGLLQSVLLIFGALSWQKPRQVSLLVVVLSFVAMLLATVMILWSSYRAAHEPVVSFALRNLPRTILLAGALAYCGVVFLRQSVRTQSWGTLLTAIFALLYSLGQLNYSYISARFLFPTLALPWETQPPHPADLASMLKASLFFFDLINLCGISLGMIIMLLEHSARTERELEAVERKTLGLATDNVSLQEEIQARLQIQEALRESEARYRDLVQSSEDLICTHDLEGKILSINPAPCIRLGYEPAELLGRNLSDLLDSKYRPQFLEFLERLARYGRDAGYMVVLTRRGHRRILEYKSTLRDDGINPPLVHGMARDVTERVRAEQALQVSEAKFAAAFRSSGSAMTISSLIDGRFLDANDVFLRQIGYRREEIIGRSPVELGIWADPMPLQFAMETTRELGRVTGRQIRVRTRSGEIRTAMYSVTMIKVDGEPCALCAGDDITDRLRAEMALRESEEKFRTVAETAVCGIWILQDKKIVYANKFVEIATGYTREELSCMDAWELVAPEFRSALQARADAPLSAPRLMKGFQYKIFSKSGQEVWIELTDSAIQFQGRPAILATAVDVTAAKLAEQKLRERTTFLDTLIASNPIAIVVKDANKRVVSCNHAFERIFQYSQSEIVGQDLDELIATNELQAARQLTGLAEAGGVVHTTGKRLRKDGSPVEVEIYGLQVRSDGRLLGAFAMYQDVAERRGLERKMKNLLDRLKTLESGEADSLLEEPR